LGAVLNALKTVCRVWSHAKDTGIVQRREVFGEDVRLDARGPNIDLGAVLNGIKDACQAWSRAVNAGIIQQRGTFGDEVRLDARSPGFTSEELEAMKGKVHKIISSIEASQNEELPEWLKSWPIDW
jgi:hypothetical protein